MLSTHPHGTLFSLAWDIVQILFIAISIPFGLFALYHQALPRLRSVLTVKGVGLAVFTLNDVSDYFTPQGSVPPAGALFTFILQLLDLLCMHYMVQDLEERDARMAAHSARTAAAFAEKKSQEAAREQQGRD
ncbi:hypothetical protein EMPS_10782 [Entomortierella parvispora]|uniref:Uncharacterized protein n=1 Tax=Entomortierella parvispora TaxID=205924 RepID=A0A9P3HL88_9FUNG|nr:hypothetical protein EMPS_10782 [Entomortierella parvispora]